MPWSAPVSHAPFGAGTGCGSGVGGGIGGRDGGQVGGRVGDGVGLEVVGAMAFVIVIVGAGSAPPWLESAFSARTGTVPDPPLGSSICVWYFLIRKPPCRRVGLGAVTWALAVSPDLSRHT